MGASQRSAKCATTSGNPTLFRVIGKRGESEIERKSESKKERTRRRELEGEKKGGRKEEGERERERERRERDVRAILQDLFGLADRQADR